MATDTDDVMRRRILVVDDEPSIREFFKFVLESDGCGACHSQTARSDALTCHLRLAFVNLVQDRLAPRVCPVGHHVFSQFGHRVREPSHR